jgi:ABC-type dipeptide/oligopeptide/nickel transport system permease component
MKDSTWAQAFAELVGAVLAVLVRFWKQDIVQVGLTVGMFFALAVPLLIVILVLWWIDSTGWQATSGFYKIGMSADSLMLGARTYAAGLASCGSEAHFADIST